MFNNKFGMFIHFGIYSQTEFHEQVFSALDMEREEYEKLATTFNPEKYNPEEWVLLAKNAGMKYICFTTKHHDGFCMWDTKTTDYNVMNTPYKKDILKMLSNACKKYGMKLSLYYSNPDWHYEYGYNPNSSHQFKAVKTANPDTQKLREYIKAQVTELLTNYGEIYTMFWDIPPRIEDKSINELCRKLQPNILINNRGFDGGDFSTPEREMDEIENSARFSKPTEACNSVGEHSWGYRSNEDFFSVRYLTQFIDKIMAMNGSYLLNVGPKWDGTIDEKYAERIRKIGDFYNRTEGVLENPEPNTFDYGIQRDNCIVNVKNGKTYFHFYNGIRSTGVAMKNYPSLPKKIRLLNNKQELDYKIEFLPEFRNENGKCVEKFLHIENIPVDDLQNEPIIIEIEWQNN